MAVAKLLKSRFEHVHSDNNSVIATLLDPGLKPHFMMPQQLNLLYKH